MINPPSTPPRALLAILASGAFRRLWTSQFATVTMVYGLSLAGIALVEQETGSSMGAGLVILSSILPAFLSSLLAGAVVDRFGRRPVLLIVHLVRAAAGLAFGAATLLLPPGPALLAIVVVNVVVAVCGQFAFPAELALVPDLVAPARLALANTLLQFGMLAGEALGVVLFTPLLIKLAGVPAVGLSGALLCLAAFGLVLGLPREAGGAAVGRRLTWGDLKAGWSIIAHDRLLRVVAVQATVAATLLLVLLALLPGLVARHLGVAVEDAPFLILPGGLAFALGAVLVSRREAWLGTQGWIVAGLLTLGLGTGLLGLAASGAASLGLALGAIVLVGLGLGAVVIPTRVVMQRRPPRELRGRVIAGQLALANAGAVLPLLLGGSLADRLGLAPVFWGLAAAALLAALAGLPWRGRSGGARP